MVIASALPHRLFSADLESFQVRKVETSSLEKFKNALSKIFGSGEDMKIPPAREVTWNDLNELDLNTNRPSRQLMKQLNSEVSIKGFIIPMDFDGQWRITELLLVPYIPSCMHIPPPPSNQMIHVKLHEAKKIDDPYIPIEAVGHLKIAKTDFAEDQLTTSYAMDVRSLEILTDSDMDPTKDFFGNIFHENIN